MSAYVVHYDSGMIDYLESLDGVVWLAAPKPRRFHRCRPQTRGLMGARPVARCACGAISLDRGRRWQKRNSR